MKLSKDSGVKQRKWGKNGYLSDFQRSAEGAYVYTGRTWRADPAVRQQLLKKLWVLQAAMLLSVILPGLMTTAGLVNSFYVILPYVFWLISDIVLAYTLGRMTFGGNPMRNYVYERSAARYGSCAAAPLTGAVLTAAGLTVFLLRGGTGEGAVLCFLCAAAQLVLSVLARRCRASEIWTCMKASGADRR